MKKYEFVWEKVIGWTSDVAERVVQKTFDAEGKLSLLCPIINYAVPFPLLRRGSRNSGLPVSCCKLKSTDQREHVP